jgi:hypothetical protein
MLLDGKLGSIVVDTDVDPALVRCEIIDAIRDGFAELGIDEVMDSNLFGLSFWSPLPASILEIAHQLLLPGVDGDDRLSRRRKSLALRLMCLN